MLSHFIQLKLNLTPLISVAISTSTVAGSSLIFPSELYDAVATLHCIERYRCTALYGVTTMFLTEMAHPTFAKIDKSSLKYVFDLLRLHFLTSHTLTNASFGPGSALWLARPCPRHFYGGS